MSSAGSDRDISASKVDPLASDFKSSQQSDQGEGGVIGTDGTIDQARVDPVGGSGQYQNPSSVADTQGVAGRDNTIAGAKLDPLDSSGDRGGLKQGDGLDDEIVDGARTEPLGEVREEMR